MHTRTIVCGVDGSPGGRATVRVAASLANQFGVPLEERAARTVPAAARASAPIMVAVDGSATRLAAAKAAIELARALDSSLLFVYVRRRPSSIWGAPFYQRRLSREMRHARSALAYLVRLALDAGVDVEGEIIEGSPRRGIDDFASARCARPIVGSRRRPTARDKGDRAARPGKWASGADRQR
jgi:nucleotide-binding universal stress UspA family protein